ncbi:UvrD-helicase domain-containing protein [Bacteriovorax sp. PP10]|uniref:DNA 3'-5' helicase n=1 Tax=Bacteriovorax antarcticus TaxID=3088717 RepID=A0ABU5VW01_9BACT|nr:UvrD-helicase domain-containing protein [Bacteriovorax sp. PP10]MEA9356558.1 UvrD-helicase domain-containing protein [Bacteriovorax sp. PP10]
MSSSTGVKTPNAEQMIAINHLGGKILSAGAGSGKTFVLIEHIITWLDNLRMKTPASDWPQVIPFQLPKVVLMTFTKKAAGEMSIRMMKRLDDLCDSHHDDKEGEFWEIVRQYLSMMNITTISSFCHQLLGLGYFQDVGSDVQILSNVEFKNKISNLFNLWFISKSNNLNQVFQANSTALIGAMIEIYNSPELRLLWKEPLVKTSPERELNEYVGKMINELGLEDLFDGSLDLNADAKEREKGWFVLLQSFDQLIQTSGNFSADSFKAYAEWAMNVGRLPIAVKAMSEDQKFHLEKIKVLVKELRDIQEDFINFIENYDTYWSWVEIFQEVYNFIDRNYFLEKGFAFADLEYYTCVGLRNSMIREKIKKNYDYFIVDEFQDTSSVQYEIIQHLVGDNHQRIFCVGDKKQAIYGFRGGELLVFNQCSELLGTENNIWLKNNFRSEGNVIRFNNHFFERIFPLGHGFEGIDPNTVLMEAQAIPEAKTAAGEVERFKTEIMGLESDKKLDLDFYEAEALYQVITDLLARDEIENVCVLYRKLRPSALLLDLLAENEVAFSAQVKVQYGEDPIINLFLRSIELKLNQNDPLKLSSTHFLMNSLLEVLNVNAKAADIQERFLGDLSILGLRLAFHKLVYSFGISNSQYQENSKLIDSICRVCNEDLIKVFHLLSSESEEAYSLQLMNGARAKRVIIMSAHASKGLEFDAVLLGGIHNNGVQMGKTDTIGKLPKSFRWKKVYNQKKFYKSPTYYLEADIDKAKEFSESKRLLYVACTRAVKYLGWIDLWATIDGKEKILSTGSNHWIKAMRIAKENDNLIIEKTIQLGSKAIHQEADIPLILKDSLGIVSLGNHGRLGVFADTSVTKLAQLAQCPFKFYLSNICKITPPKLSPKIFMDMGDDEEGIEAEEVFYSSMERGTRVHAGLSKLMLGEMELSDVAIEEREKLEWVLSEADKVFDGKNVISEKQIKFSFFGQMISGTPDLIFEDDTEVIVWDFKTGTRDESNEESYWFQLMCYGYAYANLKHFTPEKSVPLTLLYVDQKQSVTKVLTLGQISALLFEKWSKTESLNQVNLEHCFHCDYSSICVHYKSSAP